MSASTLRRQNKIRQDKHDLEAQALIEEATEVVGILLMSDTYHGPSLTVLRERASSIGRRMEDFERGVPQHQIGRTTRAWYLLRTMLEHRALLAP